LEISPITREADGIASTHLKLSPSWLARMDRARSMGEMKPIAARVFITLIVLAFVMLPRFL
jgi:hypothetical protein